MRSISGGERTAEQLARWHSPVCLLVCPLTPAQARKCWRGRHAQREAATPPATWSVLPCPAMVRRTASQPASQPAPSQPANVRPVLGTSKRKSPLHVRSPRGSLTSPVGAKYAFRLSSYCKGHVLLFLSSPADRQAARSNSIILHSKTC